MEQIFKKLIDLATEVRDWGVEMKMPYNFTYLGNYQFYYANNHSMIGFGNKFIRGIEVSFHTPETTITAPQSMLNETALQTLYTDMRAEFDKLKSEKQEEIKAENEKKNQERIKKLRDELDALTN